MIIVRSICDPNEKLIYKLITVDSPIETADTETYLVKHLHALFIK